MNKLIDNRSFLTRLSKNPKLITKASLPELKCVVEILSNLGRIPLTKEEKRVIARHLPVIRTISKCARERKARAQIVQYGGGFLAAIIPAALALADLALRK